MAQDRTPPTATSWPVDTLLGGVMNEYVASVVEQIERTNMLIPFGGWPAPLTRRQRWMRLAKAMPARFREAGRALRGTVHDHCD